jgi:hypothetical protein
VVFERKRRVITRKLKRLSRGIGKVMGIKGGVWLRKEREEVELS